MQDCETLVEDDVNLMLIDLLLLIHQVSDPSVLVDPLIEEPPFYPASLDEFLPDSLQTLGFESHVQLFEPDR